MYRWLCTILFCFPVYDEAQPEVLKYVNPLIGTAKDGHVFAGATLPYGMVKAVADTIDNNWAGFGASSKKVTGFSHMHDSGTGGGSSMGNFPLFPFAGCANDQLDKCPSFQKDSRAVNYNKDSVKASPGYFSIGLSTGIVGEATATAHTALYNFNFPGNPQAKNASLNPVIIMDLTDLYESMQNGNIRVDPASGRMTASATFTPSFGEGYYKSYVCADFAGAAILSSGTWNILGPNPHNKSAYVPMNGAGGGFVQFDKPNDGDSIQARVGMSFISINKACQNAEDEIPQFAAKFDSVRKTARTAWAKKFGVIEVDAEGVHEKLKETFWSGIYRSMISPQDYTGENPLWQSNEPYYDSYYCIWDSFRSTHPLLTILDPIVQTKMVRSLIDIYKNTGWLPDCRMQLSPGYTQGGSNAEVVLADSYLKGISHGIDWNLAYKGMIKDAEVIPDDSLVYGREYLNAYKSLGYCTQIRGSVESGLKGGTVSRTVEYAYDDFCIAEMAKSMGKTSDYQNYIKRSSNWKNLFKQDQKSALNGNDTGFHGFLQPRFQNGSFYRQNPTRGSPANDRGCCGLFSENIETYEGSIWLYTFFVPGDMAGLIRKLGGRKEFTKRLLYLHNNRLVDVGNEQAFLTIFQFHYAGRPGLSAKLLRHYVPGTFNANERGLPGNDDSGAIGSFLAWSMIGIFPNPGQNVYFILPPYFKSVSITNQITMKTAHIKTVNFDPSGTNFYIQSAKLNGKRYRKNWIDHDFFSNGGTLELTLGGEESSWGRAEEDVPPSLSTTGLHPGVRDA